MSFYVRRSPSQCDPRSPIMGHINLNGIQTPPARLYFDGVDVGTPATPWTYNGPLGTNVAMDKLVVDLITPPCEPRFCVWELTFDQQFDTGIVECKIRVEKTDQTLNPFGDWDTYFLFLSIGGELADEPQVATQTFEGDYSEYLNIGGPTWWWGGSISPDQMVNAAKVWPCAWDRLLPGPPFVPLV